MTAVTPNAPPETTATRPDESLWSVVRQAVRDLPAKEKLSLRISVGTVFVALAGVGVITWWDGDGVDALRLLSLLLSMSGMLLLGVFQVLHRVSQHGPGACSELELLRSPHKYFSSVFLMKTRFFNINSQVMDRVFLVLPVIGALSAVLIAAGLGLLIPTITFEKLTVGILRFGLLLFIGAYFVVAFRSVVVTTRFLYQYGRDQAEAAARAREEAVEAQLSALQSQMNPHFLFNALNTAASLVRTNGHSAETTIENLAQVLRKTLDRSQTPTGTLRDEVEYLRAYLAVEKERWGDRLRVHWDLDEEALDAALPPLSLQPLVENALVHGIGNRLEGGEMTIGAARENGTLRVTISDDGPGFPRRYEERTGLRNLRKRLTTLYGEDALLSHQALRPGSRVTLEIPVERPAPEALA